MKLAGRLPATMFDQVFFAGLEESINRYFQECNVKGLNIKVVTGLEEYWIVRVVSAEERYVALAYDDPDRAAQEESSEAWGIIYLTQGGRGLMIHRYGLQPLSSCLSGPSGRPPSPRA